MEAHIKTNKGTIKLDLFYKQTPITVSNFVNLSKRGYYNNISFHRVIDNFMIQGGCPIGTGTGGPGYEFDDEFHPDLKHDQPGVLSMANAGPNTNGSQFFICFDDCSFLNNQYTVWGEVIEGMENVDELNRGEPPAQPDKVTSMKLAAPMAPAMENEVHMDTDAAASVTTETGTE